MDRAFHSAANLGLTISVGVSLHLIAAEGG